MIRVFPHIRRNGILQTVETVVKTLAETQSFADRVVGVLRRVGWADDRAVVLGISGDLGAGKTAFVQCVAKALGVADTVTSSSFVLRSDYTTTDIAFKHLIHLDAYRLENSVELDTVGWDDALAQPHTLLVVEWAEQVTDRLPDDVFSVTISVSGDRRVFSTTILDDA